MLGNNNLSLYRIKGSALKTHSINEISRSRRMVCTAVAGWMFCTGPFASAQPAGQLYDPEPPADSAYVRVLVVQSETAIDVSVDGKLRATKLHAADASEYLVLSKGKHVLGLHPAGKSNAVTSYTIDVVPGKALTLAFPALKTDATPSIFEDKANTNKLKSLLSAYHLDSKVGALNVLTADGKTKVFGNLSFGASNAIAVNPISIDLIAAKATDNSNTPGASKTSLSMTAGANYSVFLVPNNQGMLTARATQNKTEKYTGK
jgi:alginate O-acetyltransferase complex protein AlgF